MTLIDFNDFDKLYRQAASEVLALWTPAMQSRMARHCRAWDVERFDFRNYLLRSSFRYYLAYRLLAETRPVGRLCDVGGFWGAFPLTLRRLGYSVAMTEAMRYYSGAFDDIFSHVSANGVEIIDFDPFDAESVSPGPFDAVTAMAILEHYPHSQRTFMHHVRRMLSPGGSLYVEVPNLAYWHKRIGLLLGHSPLPAIEDVYHSDVPFTGHHREFTIHDLRQLARLSGLNIRKEKCYNYSVSASLLRQPAQTLANFLWPATRECLAMLCDVGDPEGSPMTDPKDCPDLAST